MHKGFSLLALLLFSAFAFGQARAPHPKFQSVTLGDIEVIALSDGTAEISAHELLTEKKKGSISLLLDQAFLKDPVEISINAYLIKLSGKLVLVDTGSGELFGASGGQLIASIKQAGFSPDSVTDILITHIHLDHSGGLVAKGMMNFPNATVHVNQKEIDFWSAHELPAKGEVAGISANRGAYLAMQPYLKAGKVKTFKDGASIFPEINAVEFAGHTPGHTVFVLQSKGEKLVFWGDLIHVATVQLHHPDLLNGYDSDQQQAILQREKAYKMAATEGYLIAADHISFPGIGRLGRGRPLLMGTGTLYGPGQESLSAAQHSLCVTCPASLGIQADTLKYYNAKNC